MPAISAAAAALVKDGRFTRADVDALKTAVQDGRAKVADVEAVATRFVDALDAGVGSAIQQLLRDIGGRQTVSAPLANLAGAPALLNGTVQLPRDATTRKDCVEIVQKGLLALANRTGEPKLAMSAFGADKSWGSETADSVKAFQTKYASKYNLSVTGDVDMDTANALDKELKATSVPAIFATAPSGPTADDVVKAALALVNNPILGPSFGENKVWRCVDKNHSEYRGMGKETGIPAGRWKCNLFANACLAVAGFQPAMYNGTTGNYAIAVELHRFSTQFAGRKGIFNQVDTFKPADFADPQKRAEELLAKVKPGDLVIVRHHGGAGSDGGHCRVVTADNHDGTFDFAQASVDAAVIRNEGASTFTAEQEVWILRPTAKRTGPNDSGPIAIS